LLNLKKIPSPSVEFVYQFNMPFMIFFQGFLMLGQWEMVIRAKLSEKINEKGLFHGLWQTAKQFSLG
jgi:hypothetical protein